MKKLQVRSLWLCAALVAVACDGAGGVELRGHVVIDGETDHSGVLVTATGAATGSAQTNAAGQFVLPNLPAGQYAIVWTADATLEKTQVRSVELGEAAQTIPDLHFTATGFVSGTITLAGEPGPGASLFVNGTSAMAVSDQSGAYRVDEVPTGERTIAVTRTGYRTATKSGVLVRRRQETVVSPIDLTIDTDGEGPVAALVGTALRIDRADHSGTVVTATLGSTRYTTTTASDGSYRFDDIGSGVYQLQFDHDGFRETIPQVLALPGSTGQIVDGALYPLASHPLYLPRARRLAAKASTIIAVDGSRALGLTIDASPEFSISRLTRIDLPSGTETVLATDARYLPSNIKVAPDKSWVGVLTGDGLSAYTSNLVRIDLATGVVTTLATSVFSFEISADSSRVVYSTFGSELFGVAKSGGTPIPLGVQYRPPFLWHPDGERVVFQTCTSSECSVFVARIDGTTPPAAILTLPLFGDMILSPNGDHVAYRAALTLPTGYYSESPELWLAALDGQDARLVYKGKHGKFLFSSDGSHLAWGTWAGESSIGELKIASVADPASQPAIIASSVRDFAFPADGSRVLYTREGETAGAAWRELRQQQPLGGSEVLLGTSVSGPYLVPPNGARTIFVDEQGASGGRLQTATSSGQTTTIAAPVLNLTPTLTGDGAHVIYATDSPLSYLVRRWWSAPVEGGTSVLLVEGEKIWFPVPSPGGAFVGFSSATAFGVVPAAGGAFEALVRSGTPLWQDDKHLLIQAGALAPFGFQNGIYYWEATP